MWYNPRMDHLNFIIAYESGECSFEEIVEGFQALINSGVVWSLQGSYSWTAQQLIAGGHCTS